MLFDSRKWLTLLAKPSDAIRIFGRMRTSNPAMENSRFGLSLEYTLTKELSHSSVVRLRGSRFFMSQNTARPCANAYRKTQRQIQQNSRRSTAADACPARMS